MTPTTTIPGPVFADLAGTRRFTVDEYHRLVDADILRSGDRVELLEGYVLIKPDYPERTPADPVFPEWRWLRRWSAEEYQRMLDLGIIDRAERLERLDGYLVLKVSQKPTHRAAVTRLHTRLAPRLPPGWVVYTQAPVAFGSSDPEPDGIVVRKAETDYDARTPAPADFGIVIEVSDSTLRSDRRG